MTDKSASVRGEYGTQARKLAAMIQINGLANTVAFHYSKDNIAQSKLVEHLEQRLQYMLRTDQQISTAMQAQLLRWLALVECYQYTEKRQPYFVLTTAQPLIVGLGFRHVHETGLILHPITGAPAIPGSTLKGVTRTYALLELVKVLGITEWDDKLPLLKPLDDLLMDKELNLSDITTLTNVALTADMTDFIHAFRHAFGTVSRAGCAIFFEGIHMSEKPPRFSVDIMNPHYGKYYGSPPNAPADDQIETVCLVEMFFGELLADLSTAGLVDVPAQSV